jgi:hypothetical protein
MACAVTDTAEFKWSLLINVIEDFGLLGITTTGALHTRTATKLSEILCLQSLLWTLAAILAKLPTLVCHSCSKRRLVCRGQLILLHYPDTVFQEHQR